MGYFDGLGRYIEFPSSPPGDQRSGVGPEPTLLTVRPIEEANLIMVNPDRIPISQPKSEAKVKKPHKKVPVAPIEGAE